MLDSGVPVVDGPGASLLVEPRPEDLPTLAAARTQLHSPGGEVLGRAEVQVPVSLVLPEVLTVKLLEGPSKQPDEQPLIVLGVRHLKLVGCESVHAALDEVHEWRLI